MRHRGTTSSNPAHARSSLAVASVALVALAGLLVVTGDTALAVSQATPRNTAEPVISGSTRVGATLATNRGSWANAPTSYSYQWVRCEPDGGRPDGADCAAIGGATTTRYVLAPADVGRRLRARVTARNDDGAATVASNPTDAIVSASVPVNTRRPTISGRAEVNQQLRVEPGTWSGRQPITYSYQWLRCDNRGDNCVTQPGFVDDNYVLRDGDIGRRARVRVTAINSDGTSSRLTAPSAVVAALSGPPGAIKLSNGETSIPVTSVPSTERLIVDVVGFEPNVVRSLDTTLTIRVKVKDTRGYVVRDANVFIRSTPVVTTPAPETKTATEGIVTFSVRPERDFPIRNGYNVQFFVKAFRPGDNPLGGIAGYRLVQVPTART